MIEPRRLKIPIRKLGASGIFVTCGHSTTSSTSSTDRQNRSRPARKMQYCLSGGRSSAASSGCSLSGAASAAASTRGSCPLILVIKSRARSIFFSFSTAVAVLFAYRLLLTACRVSPTTLLFPLSTEHWVLSTALNKPLLRRQQLLCRKRLHYVAVGSLLLSPELVASA